METIKQYTNNILALYFKANQKDYDQGTTWYSEARQFAQVLCLAHDLTLEQSCGLIAAYSINANWQLNKRFVKRFLDKDDSFKGLKNAFNKASDIMCLNNPESVEDILNILNGNKIRNFFLNILDENIDAVTVDRHAARIAGMSKAITNKRYVEISTAYISAAHYLREKRNERITASQLQAVTWCCYRRIMELNKRYGANV